jgi:hypothetical protein
MDPLRPLTLQLVINTTSCPLGANKTLDTGRDFDAPNTDPKRVGIVEIKDLRQTLEIENGFGDRNAWVE